MIQFQNPSYLYGLLVLIPLILVFASYLFSRSKMRAKLGNKDLIHRLTPSFSQGRILLKFGLILTSIVLLVVGLANPQIGTKYEKVERKGVDIFIALDVSKSMLATDIIPERMAKAKQLVSNLISQMTNHRVGLIVFAGNAYLQMPLTVDYGAGKMYLKTVNTEMIPSQGTAIGEAVRMATNSFNQEEDKHKALIIISDGENHEGDAIDAIENAVESGVKVLSVGVGTEQGAPIPLNNNGLMKRDREGNLVLTKLNESMLKKVAKKGNGNYYNITESNVSDKLIDDLAGMQGRKLEEQVIADYKDQFFWFLGIALLLLVIDFLIPERKRMMA